MKKILIIIFYIILSIVFCNEVKAIKQVTCEYTNVNDNKTIYLYIEVKGDTISYKRYLEIGGEKKSVYYFDYEVDQTENELTEEICPKYLSYEPFNIGNFSGYAIRTYNKHFNDDFAVMDYISNPYTTLPGEEDIGCYYKTNDVRFFVYYQDRKIDLYISGEKYENVKIIGEQFQNQKMDSYSFECPKVIGYNIENGTFSMESLKYKKKSFKVEVIGATPCYYYDKDNCEKSETTACIWVENEDAAFNQGGYCNVDNLLYVGCGGASDIPVQIPSLISMLVNLLKIATPIILIFISIITLLKAMSAGKEDEIKKATSSLVKKMIAAAMVFFVIGIVQFVMSKVAEYDDYNGMTDCFDCFLNNSCEDTTYYKTVVAGEDICTFLTKGEPKACADLFKESE